MLTVVLNDKLRAELLDSASSICTSILSLRKKIRERELGLPLSFMASIALIRPLGVLRQDLSYLLPRRFISVHLDDLMCEFKFKLSQKFRAY